MHELEFGNSSATLQLLSGFNREEFWHSKIRQPIQDVAGDLKLPTSDSAIVRQSLSFRHVFGIATHTNRIPLFRSTHFDHGMLRDCVLGSRCGAAGDADHDRDDEPDEPDDIDEPGDAREAVRRIGFQRGARKKPSHCELYGMSFGATRTTEPCDVGRLA